jgi:hypothetical protein
MLGVLTDTHTSLLRIGSLPTLHPAFDRVRRLMNSADSG